MSRKPIIKRLIIAVLVLLIVLVYTIIGMVLYKQHGQYKLADQVTNDIEDIKSSNNNDGNRELFFDASIRDKHILEQKIIDQYGLTSEKQFVSCMGTETQTYPSDIYGIVSICNLDANKDKRNEMVVFRVIQTESDQEAQLLAEIYETAGGELRVSASQAIYNISFCTASNIYLFYSDSLNRYCIMVDSFSWGSYTGVNSWSAEIYTISDGSIDEFICLETVPHFGRYAEFESEFRKLNVPYAKYCTSFDERDDQSYFQPLCEIEHEMFGENMNVVDCRNHRLKIKNTIES